MLTIIPGMVELVFSFLQKSAGGLAPYFISYKVLKYGEDSGDKTEEPTPNKIREARKKGQIAKKQEITSAIMLLVSFYTFKLVGPMMLNRISGHTTMVFNFMDLEFHQRWLACY